MSRSPPAQIVSDLRIVSSTSFASYVLLVWDFFLTIEDEITYIWSSPRSAVKILYLCNRYGNLLVQPISLAQRTGLLNINQSSTCLAFVWIKSVSQFLTYGSVHILVLLRAWVLCGRSRKPTIALFAAFMIYICSCTALVIYALGVHHDKVWASETGTCTGAIPNYTWLLWVVSFLLDVGLFLVTITMLRQQTTFPGHSQISHLIRGLYKESVLFLLANTLADVLNMVAWVLYAKRPLNFMANSLCFALVNITGQRLAVDLRRTYVCKKELTPSELSKEVHQQIAALSFMDMAGEPVLELEPIARVNGP
ncbi:hypothetical protein BJ138DRAFT_844906 [Hygrophoropsis aurantiaca]|uniref:Uncharacterized protein n=1 Tax=Hygrophoropsis aurantiaca TaxID=72124 RepID=A0ACB7ZV86_9AGAM|nr:hypothetical protein BJ138DRAFT_844906 [Hygrophoropsis aurantiaca]